MCKNLTKQILKDKPEVELLEWRNKKSSEKEISLVIEDVLQSKSVNDKQIQKAIDKDNLVQQIIELARVNL